MSEEVDEERGRLVGLFAHDFFREDFEVFEVELVALVEDLAGVG